MKKDNTLWWRKILDFVDELHDCPQIIPSYSGIDDDEMDCILEQEYAIWKGWA